MSGTPINPRKTLRVRFHPSNRNHHNNSADPEAGGNIHSLGAARPPRRSILVASGGPLVGRENRPALLNNNNRATSNDTTVSRLSSLSPYHKPTGTTPRHNNIRKSQRPGSSTPTISNRSKSPTQRRVQQQQQQHGSATSKDDDSNTASSTKEKQQLQQEGGIPPPPSELRTSSSLSSENEVESNDRFVAITSFVQTVSDDVNDESDNDSDSTGGNMKENAARIRALYLGVETVTENDDDDEEAAESDESDSSSSSSSDDLETTQRATNISPPTTTVVDENDEISRDSVLPGSHVAAAAAPTSATATTLTSQAKILIDDDYNPDDNSIDADGSLMSLSIGERSNILRQEDYDDDENKKKEPIIICGCFPIPRWTRPDWIRISQKLARYAPCFWCSSGNRFVAATDRTVIIRLLVLLIFGGFVQACAGIMYIVIMSSKKLADRSALTNFAHDKHEGEGASSDIIYRMWSTGNNAILAGVVGLTLSLVSFWALRVIKNVDLKSTMRYLWFLIWIVPLLFLFVVNLFDFHDVTTVWIKHWWHTSEAAFFREKRCRAGSSRDECVVPIGGWPVFGVIANMNGTSSPAKGEHLWCQYHYQQTKQCSIIRNHAQDGTRKSLLFFYSFTGAWGSLLILVTIATIRYLEAFLTKPLVQRSRESNIPGWLTFPVILSFFQGFLLTLSPSTPFSVIRSSVGYFDVIVIGFLATGSFFFIGAMLGWFISSYSILNQRDKFFKQAAIFFFILCMVITVCITISFTAVCILQVVGLSDILSDNDRGTLACFLDVSDSCSFCDNRLGIPECPEWTEDDVRRVVKTQFKSFAVMYCIFLFYASSVLRFGFTMRAHIRDYQIDYV